MSNMDISPVKQLIDIENDDAMNTPEKGIKRPLMQTLSIVEEPQAKIAKLRTLNVKGQLLTKTTMSINNEDYYLFKFLVNNKSIDYYGTQTQFFSLINNKTYELVLQYSRKKLLIKSYEQCEDEDLLMTVCKSVTLQEFCANEIKSLLAKFLYGFKIYGSANVYKLVFVILLEDNNGTINGVQVEMMSDFKRLSGAFKNHVIENENDLFDCMYKSEEKYFNLYRIKCNHNANNFKSLSLSSNSQLERLETDDSMFEYEFQYDYTVNISRSNKIIQKHRVTGNFTSERNIYQNSDRFVISYDTANEKIKTSIYNRMENAESKTDYDTSITLKDVTLSQLNSLIESNLVQVDVYLVTDPNNVKNNVIAGITKIEIDGTYEPL